MHCWRWYALPNGVSRLAVQSHIAQVDLFCRIMHTSAGAACRIEMAQLMAWCPEQALPSKSVYNSYSFASPYQFF